MPWAIRVPKISSKLLELTLSCLAVLTLQVDQRKLSHVCSPRCVGCNWHHVPVMSLSYAGQI